MKKIILLMLFILPISLSSCNNATSTSTSFTMFGTQNGDSYQVNLKADTTTEGQGTVSGAARYAKGDVVTVTATPSEGSVFKWWLDEGVKVSEDANYTFKMAEKDINLTAVFMTNKEDETWKINQGILPAFSPLDLTRQTITYGLFPHTHVHNDLFINELEIMQTRTEPDKNGFYFYKNNYYLPVEHATPFSNNYKFSTTYDIVEGEKYWFSCSKIYWKILDSYSNTGEYLVTSEHLLYNPDFTPFTSLEENYGTSNLRNWLNGEFYNNAFYYNKDKISKYIYSDEYDSIYGQTDNVFILTESGYTNKEYGFEYVADRAAKPTDYAMANGCYYSKNYKTGKYWTASTCFDGYRGITIDGKSMDIVDPTSKAYCVRPSMIIKNICE